MSKWKERLERIAAEIISILMMYLVVIAVAGTIMAIVAALNKLIN